MYACLHVYGYMCRPEVINLKDFYPSLSTSFAEEILSELAALRCNQSIKPAHPQSHSRSNDRLPCPPGSPYAGLTSCPHDCVVSTLCTKSQPQALRLSQRITLNFRPSCLHCLTARIQRMHYQCFLRTPQALCQLSSTTNSFCCYFVKSFPQTPLPRPTHSNSERLDALHNNAC